MTAIESCQSSSVTSWVCGPTRLIPALLTTMSRRPKSRTTASKVSSTCWRSATSAGYALASTPELPSSSAAVFAELGSTSSTAMPAPAAASSCAIGLEPELARLDDRPRRDRDERIRGEVRLAHRVRREGEQHLARSARVPGDGEADADAGDAHGVPPFDGGEDGEAVLAPAADVRGLARGLGEPAERPDEVVRRRELRHGRVADRRPRRPELVLPPRVLRQQALADERPEQVISGRQRELERCGYLLRRAALLLLAEMDEDARRARDRPDDRHSAATSRSSATMRSTDGN